MGGSLRSSLSGSRPTSHSQGHGRPCLPRPHLRPRFHKTWMERFSKHLPQAQKKRPGNTPQSLKNVRATETATDVSILPREMSRSDRGVRGREALSVSPELIPQATKKRPKNTPRSLKNVRATETATDVSILPREMSRSDRGVRNREALSDCPELLPQATKKRPRSTGSGGKPCVLRIDFL